MTERIDRIRAALSEAKYSICLERPALLDRFWSSPDGRRARHDHPFVRRAREIAFLCAQRTPRVYPDELIIGNMTSKRVAANYYPEGGSINILEDLLHLDRRRVPLHLTRSERARLGALGLRHARRSIGARALLRPGRASHFLDFFRAREYFITEEAGIGHQVGNYPCLVRHGLRHADEVARDCLRTGARPDGHALSPDNVAFYESVRITIAGIRQLADNLAHEAERQASRPSCTEQRRRELASIGAACRRVPYDPPRTFQEALQSCWLVHVAMNLEDFEQGMSFGRLDRYLRPLYQADRDAGSLTPDDAVELLASFALKTCETLPLYSERIDKYFSGNGVAQGITLGGVDEQGHDTTNQLSGLVLDAYALIRTREPAIHVRVHDHTPDWFLRRAVEVIQLGSGKPSLFGDEPVVAALQGAGMTLEHARDFAVIGCVEMASQGRTYNSSDAALFNLPLCLEEALRSWRSRSGPIPTALEFEDVVQAFRRRVREGVRRIARVLGWLEAEYREWRTTPVNSIMTEGCLDRGQDVTRGGALYDFTSIQAVGLADAGDALYAVKRLVFEENRLTLTQLVDILEANFEGYEALRLELARRFPRYGNGHAEADSMTQVAMDAFADAVREQRNSRGGRWIPGVYSMTCHIGFGQATGALPNGRRRGERLSNGLSPVDGAERKGPTAVLRSAASLDTSKLANCCALNLKFDKNLVDGELGRRALTSLFRNYLTTGGMQVQVNVLDAAVLREARENPSAHPGLVVRVAGYCAYFADLHPEVQDEILDRTAHAYG